MQKRHLFLLGGRDLEMDEIRKVLLSTQAKQVQEPAEMLADTSHAVFFADKSLSWGATLSAYNEFFSDSVLQQFQIYAVELFDDRTSATEVHIIKIDHHNSSNPVPTSLDQINQMFHKSPTRWHQLVSAYDAYHDEGLIELNATAEEINQIRSAEFNMLNIKDSDFLAAQALEQTAIKQFDVTIINSGSVRERAVYERFKQRSSKLIISSSNSITYYGVLKDALRFNDFFGGQLDAGNAFHGGGANGYFGLLLNRFNSDTQESLVQKMIDVVANKAPFSRHIFLFPFRYDIKATEDDLNRIPFMKRVALDVLQSRFESGAEMLNREFVRGWKKFDFEVTSDYKYNEYTYFYEQARGALFSNYEKKYKHYKSEKNKPSIIQYEYHTDCNPKYTIELVNGKKFELDIDHITLNFYDSGVGILAFHLINNQSGDLLDIQILSDFGRRIYPQFISNTSGALPISQTQQTFLPNAVILSDGSGVISKECFLHYQNMENIKQHPVHLASHIMKLLGKNFKCDPKALSVNEVLVEPLIDDRMFTMSWIAHAELSAEMAKSKVVNDNLVYNYDNNADWYKLIFVDGNHKGIASERLMRQLISEHTYTRWIDIGTFFGISRYSFIMLGDGGFFFKQIISNHFTSMYFQLVQLALMQRASHLRFSMEVTSISDIDDFVNSDKSKFDELAFEQLLIRARALQVRYVDFINGLYFREVTAQEQGIELYDFILDKMRTSNDVQELDREIDELNQIAQVSAQIRQTEQANNFNVVANILLPATLIAGILGINLIPLDWIDCLAWYWEWLIFAAAIVLILAPIIIGFIWPNYLIRSFVKKSKKDAKN